MKSGFSLLKKKVCNNKLSEAFFSQVPNLGQSDSQNRFDRILSQRIAAYAPRAANSASLPDGETDPRWQILNQLVDTTPSFLFRLIQDWRDVSGTDASSRSLFLGILNYFVWAAPESRAHIDSFIAGIDPNLDIKTLNARLIQKSEGDVPVPNLVFRDFISLAKSPIPLAEQDDLAGRIENLFCFEAFYQFLLTYYLDLLSQSDTETVTGFIHIIFLRLFSAVRQQELQYWGRFPEKEGMRASLMKTIKSDQPDKRHPLLRNTAFKAVQLMNPLLSLPGESTSEPVEKQLGIRLESFLSLSTMSTILFLDTLLMIKGEELVAAVLEKLLEYRHQKLPDLQNFLSSGNQKAHRALATIVGRFADRKPTPAQPGTASTDSLGAEKSGMTQDQVARYLKARLLKLYENVKVEGALTHDQIADYLAAISGDIAESLAKGSMDEQRIDGFVGQIEPEVREMSALGMLAREEKEAFQQQIRQRAETWSETHKDPQADLQEDPEIPDSVAVAPEREVVEDPFLTREIIPVGFEKGAPLIPVGAFFRFPFASERAKDEESFSQHLRYLEEAVSHSLLEEDKLAEIRSRLPDLPRLTYRKTYDIYPLNRFDETVLLVVFSLWRNNALENLLSDA